MTHEEKGEDIDTETSNARDTDQDDHFNALNARSPRSHLSDAHFLKKDTPRGHAAGGKRLVGGGVGTLNPVPTWLLKPILALEKILALFEPFS